MEAVDRMVALVGMLRSKGISIEVLDLGGGLGVAYQKGERSPDIREVVQGIRDRVGGLNITILLEPGRSIVGEAGALLTRVLYRKQNGPKEFIVVDAAMNDLIRPALYQSHHDIWPVRQYSMNSLVNADVVGPICESGDFFARSRDLPPVFPGDLLAVMTAGAYGFVQSSNYNSRPRVPEVLVKDDTWRIIRHRESQEDLVRGEVEALA
jgi:diaminopimelate decarboxylase